MTYIFKASVAFLETRLGRFESKHSTNMPLVSI
jgi:hypothetical protein